MEVRPGKGRKHILIVDDDALTSLALMKTLEAEDRKIDTVTRGTQAFENIKSRRYDLVFLEIGLSDQPGLAFLKEINTSCHCTPIVVTTASVPDGEMESAVTDHGHFLLPKPFERFTIKTLAAEILEEKGRWENAFRYQDIRTGRRGKGKTFKEV